MPRSRYVVALLASFAVAIGPAAASSNATKRPSDTLLESSVIKVTSSTGLKLYLGVFVDRFTESRPSSTTLEVSLSSNDGESHLWQFEVTNKTFTYDRATSSGGIHTGPSQIAPLGHLSLTVTPRGASQSRTCTKGDSWVKQPVTITGVVVFRTRSTAWGHIVSAQHMLTFKGRSLVETDYGNLEDSCFEGGSLPACDGAVNWESPGGDHGLFYGFSYLKSGKERGAIQFTTSHSLKAPAGASIDNDVYLTNNSPPTIVTQSNGTRVVTIDAGTHGLITGSATLTSIGPPKTHGGSCRGGLTTEWPASYTNGTNPLTVHLAIGGNVQNGNKAKGAYIDQDAS
jgi:hypothetical protein